MAYHCQQSGATLSWKLTEEYVWRGDEELHSENQRSVNDKKIINVLSSGRRSHRARGGFERPSQTRSREEVKQRRGGRTAERRRYLR